ncbi:MAG: hypothetical protein AAGA48_10525 [Myxococcota bacterium]
MKSWSGWIVGVAVACSGGGADDDSPITLLPPPMPQPTAETGSPLPSYGLDERPSNPTCTAFGALNSGSSEFPVMLSQTGCMDPQDPRVPLPGLIPYETAHQFWSDGADKERWLALPDGEQITIGEDGVWSFPAGTVIVKQFSRSDQPIETRLYVRYFDEWRGYSYAWNATLTDAEYSPQGRIITTGTGAWNIPSAQQCVECHTRAAGITLGLRTEQLATGTYYPSTGRFGHQLVTMAHIGLFTNPPSEPESAEALPSRQSPEASTEELARAYLDVNCGSCHRPDSEFQGRSEFDARRTTPLADMGLCSIESDITSFGIEDAQLIAPGDPARSIVIERMTRRGEDAMPPAGSLIADALGLQVVSEWIEDLPGCD